MTATLTRCRTILYLGDVIKSFNKEKTSKDDDDDDDADNDCFIMERTRVNPTPIDHQYGINLHLS